MIFTKQTSLLLPVILAAGCLLCGCNKPRNEVFIKTPKGFYSGYSEDAAVGLIRSCIKDSQSDTHFAQMKVIRTSFYGSPPTEVVKTTYAAFNGPIAGDFFFKLEDAKTLNAPFYSEVKRQLSENLHDPLKPGDEFPVDLSKVSAQ